MGRNPTKERYRNPQKKADRSILEIVNRERVGERGRGRETETKPGSQS